jgi:curved DNA-binding protein CbpA
MEIDQCYKLLGLTSNATLEDVNKAYKVLALQWHPDRIPRENVQQQLQAQEKLKEINHARDSLRKVAEQKVSNSQSKHSHHTTTQSNRQYHQHQTRYQSKYQSAHQSSYQAQQQTSDQSSERYRPHQSQYQSQTYQSYQAYQSSQSRQQTSRQANPQPESHSKLHEPTQASPKSQKPDLTGADFRGANLREKYLEGRNLS